MFYKIEQGGSYKGRNVKKKQQQIFFVVILHYEMKCRSQSPWTQKSMKAKVGGKPKSSKELW